MRATRLARIPGAVAVSAAESPAQPVDNQQTQPVRIRLALRPDPVVNYLWSLTDPAGSLTQICTDMAESVTFIERFGFVDVPAAHVPAEFSDVQLLLQEKQVRLALEADPACVLNFWGCMRSTTDWLTPASAVGAGAG